MPRSGPCYAENAKKQFCWWFSVMVKNFFSHHYSIIKVQFSQPFWLVEAIAFEVSPVLFLQ